VTTPFVRVALLFLCVAFAVSVGHSQPVNPNPVEGVRPYYTAFPDIKPSRHHAVVKGADGAARVVVEKAAAVPLPALPVVAADAPAWRKVQLAQIQEGLDFLDRVKEIARLGAEDPKDVRAVAIAAEVCLLAAELEATPAKRLAWFEARVRVLKEGEESVYSYVQRGNLSVGALHLARYERLRAEADLLRLKAEIEKAKK
jgi:hypothetical protein